jgi:hypothetical protein
MEGLSGGVQSVKCSSSSEPTERKIYIYIYLVYDDKNTAIYTYFVLGYLNSTLALMYWLCVVHAVSLIFVKTTCPTV